MTSYMTINNRFIMTTIKIFIKMQQQQQQNDINTPKTTEKTNVCI